MDYQIEGSDFILRLDKGEKIISSVQSFLEKYEIKSGNFTAIGAINQVTLRYLDQPKKEFLDKEFLEEFEVTSLIGNITHMEATPYVHAHIVLGTRDYKAISGHLVEGQVGATLEVVGKVTNTSVSRKFDPTTGLNLLDFA